MKKMYSILPLLLIIILTSCNTMKKKADLIIYNAKVYTVDDDFSIADCVIIKEGKIFRNVRIINLLISSPNPPA